MQGPKITPQESENPFSESMKQWVAPTSPARSRRVGKGPSWLSSSSKHQTATPPQAPTPKSAGQEPSDVAAFWHEKNENYHVVERTIGIDSCPHRCATETRKTNAPVGMYFTFVWHGIHTLNPNREDKERQPEM